MTASFRQRVRSRERLLGTFLKTASYQTVDVLGLTGLDFVVIDAEQAPFDRNQLDVCVLAARASQFPSLVRIPDDRPHTVLDVLDMGATGVLVPHAKYAPDVKRVLAAARYRGGVRGFSNSPRGGGYDQPPMKQLVERADAESVVICQMEDREAVEAIDAIAAVDGVDCLFIGRADLAVSYGVFDLSDVQVDAAVRHICGRSAAAGKAVGIFLGDAGELKRYEALGVSLFVVGPDQSLLRAQAAALAAQFGRAG